MPNIELHPHYTISSRGKEDAQMSMMFPDSSMTQLRDSNRALSYRSFDNSYFISKFITGAIYRNILAATGF
jgi:hypothetical protein